MRMECSGVLLCENGREGTTFLNTDAQNINRSSAPTALTTIVSSEKSKTLKQWIRSHIVTITIRAVFIENSRDIMEEESLQATGSRRRLSSLKINTQTKNWRK